MKSWLLLALIHMIATEIVVVKLIDIQRQEKILISNRFKHNEILLSDESRELAKLKPDFKDFNQVPKIEIEITNSFPQKYFHIHGDIRAYVIRAVMGLQQFRQSIESKSEKEGYEVVLISKAEEDEARKHVKGENLCFYQGVSTSIEQLHKILNECLKDRPVIISHSKEPQQQNNLEQQSAAKVFIISLLTCALLTVLKLSYLKQLSKKESVV